MRRFAAAVLTALGIAVATPVGAHGVYIDSGGVVGLPVGVGYYLDGYHRRRYFDDGNRQAYQTFGRDYVACRTSLLETGNGVRRLRRCW